ncbi:MAG: hypothetical protein DCC50_04770 [Acidobacteria bacterium]|nr:MAG: hypothetical protein DCC50_04770 [Acidobacteriota bacterium]
MPAQESDQHASIVRPSPGVRVNWISTADRRAGPYETWPTYDVAVLEAVCVAVYKVVPGVR